MQEGSGFQIITLRRADQATDLWPAIEAAQYGHIVQQDADAAAKPAALSAFLAVLAEVIETWETVDPAGQAALMYRLDAGLSQLRDTGCGVHWGMVQRVLEPADTAPVEIPVAILRVGTRNDEAVEVAVPRRLTAGDDTPAAG